MKLHRFIGQMKDEAIAHQIRDVLKLRPGEEVIISDGRGQDQLVELTAVGDEIQYKIIKNIEPTTIPRRINLFLAILKKENFELAVQKATEAGVGSITPVITERTIKTGLNIARLEKIAQEASEQCGRSTCPEIFEIFDFAEAITATAEKKVIFHTGPGIGEYQPDKDAESVNIFIGPEGGFTDKEIKLAEDSGWIPASLGPLTLRGETAAIIATYLAVHCI